MIEKLNELEQMERDFGKKLKHYRERANLPSAQEVARELDLGLDAVYKNEMGKSLPFRATLNTLCRFYGLNEQEKNELFEDREAILKLRKKVK